MFKFIASILPVAWLASGCVCISDSYFPYSQCPHYREEPTVVEEEQHIEEKTEVKFAYPFRPLASQHKE